MYTELQNFNWIRNLGEINSPTLMEEYTLLHMAISSITLTEANDVIRWRWTAKGEYSAASAYEAQFKGSMSYFPANDIWRAHSEPKCRFFAWLVLHDRVLTAENLAKRN